jgi:hypothetical protein
MIPGLAKAANMPALVKGGLGYFRHPEQKIAWGGPFNGQKHRVKMFRELHRIYQFKTAFETGSYRGTTTDFLAGEIGGKVWTVESDAWSYGYCFVRCCLNSKIKVVWGDSREAIRKFASQFQGSCPIFFYLDAHWGEDLPLKGELDLIFVNWRNAVVMIDDFKVDDDPDYMFDDYGDGKCICVNYIAPIIHKYKARCFVPSLTGDKETGARRGSVVLFASEVPMPSLFSTIRELMIRSQTSALAEGKTRSILTRAGQ